MPEIHEPEAFVIYRSSAGSGKTYRLAVEYVALCVGNPFLFGKVLAVTFTNKATREMKERILDFLGRLSERSDRELLDTVRGMTSLPEDAIAENARLAMKNILHGYSRFSVSTIDAFFQKVVKSFARELGLLGNFTVELDQVKIMQEVIDRIIGGLDVEKELTEWMVDFSFQNIDESRSWNIRPQIEALAGEVFKESFRSVSEDLLKADTLKLKSFLKEIRAVRTEFEKYQRNLARQAKGLMDDYGLAVEDFSGKSRGPAGHYDKILKSRKYEPTATLRQALDDPEKWATNNSPRTTDIDNILQAGLLGLTQELVDHYDENFIHYATAGEILRNFHVYGILRRIVDELGRYRREHDVMLISDIPVFLQNIIAENDAPFIYEKTGTWYRHFLIDEFQDTSRVQWSNFKPLIVNGLSQGYKSLLVGDGKQSIYRWRGGDWNLILHRVKEDLASWRPAERMLDTNWRSCRKVVQFNNTVFGYVPPMLRHEFMTKINESSLARGEQEALEQRADDVALLYEDSEQNVAGKNLDPSRGRIEIVAYEKTEGIPWKEQALDDLPAVIERLQDAGMQARDIAVLVRTARDGRDVIEKLINYKKSPEAHERYCYDAITSESLYLGNAPVVRLLVNLVRYLQNGDKVALAEVCFNYSLITSKESDEDKEFGELLSEDVLPENFVEEARALVRLPLYEMNERIIQMLGLGGSERREYLQVYQDAVREFFTGDNRNIREFLEWWEEKGSRISVQIPDSINAIRVMTIHKSKGLEFRAVIIPFADWLLDNDAKKNNILWCRTGREPYEKMSFLPVKYSSRLADTYFARDYFEEMIKAHIDNLNLLYVALTRAEEFLMVNCPPVGRSMKNAGDALLKVLEEAVLSDPVTEEKHENKTIYTIGTLEKRGEAIAPQEEGMALAGYNSSGWRERLAIRRRGGVFTRESRDKVHYGLMAHEILANIDTEEELEPLLEQHEREGKITAENHKMLMDQLAHVFANPEVKKWFAPGWEVKREASVLMRGTSQKRPDRVMIKEDLAVIVDFKTGAEKEADKRQVLEYRDLMRQMGYAQVEAWLMYIGLNKVVKVA